MDLCLESSSSSPFYFFFAIWMFGNMATLNPAKPVRSVRYPPEPEPNHPLSGGGRWRAWWFGGFHPNQTAVPARTRPHPPAGWRAGGGWGVGCWGVSPPTNPPFPPRPRPPPPDGPPWGGPRPYQSPL